MATLGGPNIIQDGLVLHLDAANTKSYPGSGTVWSDLSGNGNTSTLIDGPVFDSTNVGIFNFEGLNDRVHTPSPSNKFAWTPSGTGNNTLTFEVWVKTSDTSGRIFSKPWNGSGEYNYWMTHSTWYHRVGADQGDLVFSSIATNTWQFMNLIITPTQKAVYRNGALVAGFTNHNCVTNTPQSGNINASLCIMSLYPYGSGWAGNTSFSISGSLSYFKVYNRALTAEEIYQNYNATKSRYNL